MSFMDYNPLGQEHVKQFVLQLFLQFWVVSLLYVRATEGSGCTVTCKMRRDMGFSALRT